MSSIASIGAGADVRVHRREERRRSRTFHAAALVITLVCGGFAFSTSPRPVAVALVMIAAACVVAMARPVLGIHVLLFLTLAGDDATAPWWPFTKNLSSRESMMFVSDAISVTPLELMLASLYLACLAPAVTRRGWQFRWGSLTRPMWLIAFFVFAGFVRGFGGIRNIALLEVRPLIYLVALYFVIAHCFTKRAHYQQALWVALLATAFQSLLALRHFWGLPAILREDLESLAEHSATLQMNALFLFGLGLVAFNGSRLQRRIVGVLAIPVVYAFLLSQRRAAMVALFAGGAILLMVLFHRRRAKFWSIAPFVAIITVGYLGATWKASGALGLPANAVKSVFFSSQLDAADQQSDVYRDLEKINVWYTIKSSPILGTGFGQPFTIIAPMPSISFFVYWQYLPHNSVLWLWIKTGVFGFLTIMFTIGRSILMGARSVLRVQSPSDVAVVLVGLGYVIMFTIFAYVDIAFTARTAAFLALSMAVCADFERAEPRLDAQPVGGSLRLRPLVDVR